VVVWNDKLFFDKSMKKKRRHLKVMDRVNRRSITMPGTTGIFLPACKDNLFELIAFNDLLVPVYKDADYVCVGMAGSYKSAEKMVCDMVAKVYKKNGYLPPEQVRKELLG